MRFGPETDVFFMENSRLSMDLPFKSAEIYDSGMKDCERAQQFARNSKVKSFQSGMSSEWRILSPLAGFATQIRRDFTTKRCDKCDKFEEKLASGRSWCS